MERKRTKKKKGGGYKKEKALHIGNLRGIAASLIYIYIHASHRYHGN